MRWILALSLLIGGSIAGCSREDHGTPMSDEKSATLDPVCGMKVDAGTALYKDEYDGKTYYFDSRDCWQKFHDNPHAYMPGGDDRDRKDVK
jgi:Cu+-exporting ATPase